MRGFGCAPCRECHVSHDAFDGKCPAWCEAHVCAKGEFAKGKKGKCVSCPAGQFSSGNNSKCKKCPKGKFAGSKKAVACADCAAGKVSSKTKGSSSCKDCGPGHRIAKNKCRACSKGQYSQFADKNYKKCTKGKYAAQEQSGACTSCPAGRIGTKTKGSSKCVKDKGQRRTLAAGSVANSVSGASGAPVSASLAATIAVCLAVLAL